MTIGDLVNDVCKEGVTVHELRTLWDVKIGNWYFDKETREKEWKAFKVSCRAKRLSVEDAYRILFLMD